MRATQPPLCSSQRLIVTSVSLIFEHVAHTGRSTVVRSLLESDSTARLLVRARPLVVFFCMVFGAGKIRDRNSVLLDDLCSYCTPSCMYRWNAYSVLYSRRTL